MPRKKIVIVAVVGILMIAGGAIYLAAHRRVVVTEVANDNSGASNHIILEGKVSVVANFAIVGDANAPPPHAYEVNMEVSKGDQKYNYEDQFYTGFNNENELLGYLKKTIIWKDNFLFVPTTCGGGNAWRCNTEDVYVIEKDKLIKIGDMITGGYEGGEFKDVYDKLEINDLTSHADAPGFTIIKKATNNKLVIDLTRTWEENQKKYLKNSSALNAVSTDNSAVTPKTELIPSLLYNYALSIYCKKQEEADKLKVIANIILDAETKNKFNAVVVNIKPGE